MLKQLLLIFTYLIAAYSITGNAATTSIDLSKSYGEVGFHAVGNPSALRINGKVEFNQAQNLKQKNLTGTIQYDESSAQGELSFDLTQLKTGMGLRDRHMKEKYLETTKFPTAKLNIKEVKLPKEYFLNREFSKKEIAFVGEFTVHGEKRTVKGSVDLDKQSDQLSINAQFKIDLQDYQIDIPSFMNVTVAKEVTVYTNLKVNLTK